MSRKHTNPHATVPMAGLDVPAIWVGQPLASAVLSTVRWIAGGSDLLAAAVLRWHQRSVTQRELLSLDDRMLEDIGIRREQIWTVADRASRGQPW